MRFVLAGVGALMVAGTLLAAGDGPAPVPLFDGKSLAGWVPEHSDRFSVRDGVLVHEGGSGWLRSEKPRKNFEFQAEYRILKEGTECGLVFRAGRETDPRAPHWPVKGYQVQISEGEGDLMLLGQGTMPPRFDRKTEALRKARKPRGEWQKIAIKARGPVIEITLNGTVVTTSSSLDLEAGHLGLLGKSGVIHWRDLKITDLPDP